MQTEIKYSEFKFRPGLLVLASARKGFIDQMETFLLEHAPTFNLYQYVYWTETDIHFLLSNFRFEYK